MTDNKSDKKRLSIEAQENAPRARNRTVMLTPDITTQVRERLSKKLGFEEQAPSQASIFDNFEQYGEDSPENISLPEQSELYPEEETLLEESASDDFERPVYAEKFAFEEAQQLNSEKSSNPISRQVFKVTTENIEDSEFETEQLVEESFKSEEDNEQDSFQPAPDAEPEEEAEAKDLPPQRRVVPTAKNIEKETTLSFKSSDILNLQKENTAMSQISDNIHVHWAKMSPIVGFFVSFDKDPNGEVLALRSGRLLVSSERPTTGSFVVIEDESVSPMHAILRVTEDGQIQILDNLSEYGTTIIRSATGEELSLSGEKALLNHGDLVKLGSRSFSVCVLKV